MRVRGYQESGVVLGSGKRRGVGARIGRRLADRLSVGGGVDVDGRYADQSSVGGEGGRIGSVLGERIGGLSACRSAD